MLANKLKNVINRPGVYLLKNSKGEICYVGKARQLRNRLRSHFNPGKFEDRKHRAMMSQVRDFETIVTDSEIEALILEANLIKENRPRYNVNLKDDKSYPYIRLTKEPFPRIFMTRNVVKDGSRYFGPYTDAHAARQLMTAIRRIFPVRTCALKISDETIAQKKHKVCLNYHIGRCYGPCEGLISHEDYHKIGDQIVAFIRGSSDALLMDLKSRMENLAGKRQYEEAARIRDQIQSLDRFQSRQKVVDGIESERDIITLAMEGNDACAVVFIVREGKIISRQHFYLLTGAFSSEEEIFGAFLKQYYLQADSVPEEIVLYKPLPDMDEINDWLNKKRGRKTALHVPLKGKKLHLIDMCQKNAELLLKELQLQREARTRIPASVTALQEALAMEKPPARIEAFDISNLQGTDTVASLVVFQDGKPKKSDYRKYKIRSVSGSDDFASMAEVVERRFSRLIRENKPLPDLLLVDGGKGQLSAATGVLERLGLKDQPVIGLAKRLEEVFVPGLPDAQNIPKSSPALKLLQQVRNEAHRFAVNFHRQQRKKRTVRSELDGIPGIGEKRRNALLKAFGSVEGIRKTAIEDIAAVKGMNSETAQSVHDFLDKPGKDSK